MLDLTDPWAAYQFDSAVIFFGDVIESAAQDREKVGDEWQPKYTLPQLLTEGFTLPRQPKPSAPTEQQQNQSAIGWMKTTSGKVLGGVKVFKGK